MSGIESQQILSLTKFKWINFEVQVDQKTAHMINLWKTAVRNITLVLWTTLQKLLSQLDTLTLEDIRQIKYENTLHNPMKLWNTAVKNITSAPLHDWSTLLKLPSQWRMLDARSTSMLTPEDIRQTKYEKSMLDIQNPVFIVSDLAIVISLDPFSILDLAGGCCRPSIFFNKRALQKYKSRNIVEYEWLFLAYHSHSKTYFHALGESVLKLMWGMKLLHDNPSMKILHNSQHVDRMLPLLGLSDRGIHHHVNGNFAKRITIPPRAQNSKGLMNGLRRMLRIEQVPKPRYITVAVVRRDAKAQYGGRAMLNHDELMFALRHILLPATMKLIEWPSDGFTMHQTVSFWNSVQVMIAPHGAGTTNMMFMPKGSQVFEIIRQGQTGKVYGSMANMLGHKFISCVYNSDHLINTSLPLSSRSTSSYTAFNIKLSMLIKMCFHGSFK